MIDVPSLGYGSEDKPHARGEICIRGTTIFSGYLKGENTAGCDVGFLMTDDDADEKNTKAAIDEEGWYHTGDVGEIDAQGRFKIIDRVKVCAEYIVVGAHTLIPIAEHNEARPRRVCGHRED